MWQKEIELNSGSAAEGEALKSLSGNIKRDYKVFGA
jgi:hypothetical protein